MADVNKEAVEFWNSLKPMIDEEIKAQTRGMVQRRKMKVTTAPSLNTHKIGVTEPFGTEMLIPFTTNLISATVGDVVWVEFMYGMTNAFASMFASADEKDWDVAGNLSVIGNAGISGNLGVSGATSLQNTTVNGVLDITPRRCYVTLSSAGWYRVMQYTGSKTGAQWATGVKIDFTIVTTYSDTNNGLHAISMVGVYHYVDFVDEVSYSNTAIVDKIRYVYGADGNGYVDIHYSVNASNAVAVDFAVHYRHDAQGNFTSIPLSAVADSPANETVMTEYEFINTTYGGMRYYRESISDITLSSAGFKTMTMPARIVGHKIVSIMISNCSTISGGAIIPLSYTDGSGNARSNYYMAGSPGANMTNALIEYWYL